LYGKIAHCGTNGQFTVVPVNDDMISSKFSINGTSPESKSGKRICYVKMLDFDEHRGVLDSELWVCDRDLSNQRKVIGGVKAGRHNAAEASWVDDDRIAFVSREGAGGHAIYVVDANSGEVLHGPIFGSICHQSQRGLVAFGVTPDEVEANKAYPSIARAGIYTLNCDTGEIRPTIYTDDLLAHFRALGLTPTERPYGTSHIQLNPSATRIMSMWGLKEYRVIASWDMDGQNIRIVHKKPVHQIWYDDESYLATYDDRTDPDRKNGKQQMYRYSQDGKPLEYIAGLGNHVDGSPDREWFVTDSLNFHDPVSLYLFRKGNHEPFMQLDSHRYLHLTWNTKVHSNPTFSRDGKRIYFSRPVSENAVKACYIDISAAIASVS
jgi:hypothetical protein